MNEKNLSELLEKTQNFEALEFLKDVIEFIKEIKPVLDSINVSIAENVQKMPTATKKLSKVTEATEVATTEILNVIDGLFLITSQIKKNHDALMERFESGKNVAVEFLNKLRQAVAEGKFDEITPEAVDRVIEILSVPIKSDEAFAELDKSQKELVSSLNDDLTSIMMSLQVQDITSQQIAAVNHLLETIRTRLMKILVKFYESNLADVVDTKASSASDNVSEGGNISQLHRAIAFDPEALSALSMKDSRQGDVDDLIAKANAGTLTDADMVERVNPEDIAAMFTEGLAAGATPAIDEEISGDDIDALFASANGDVAEEVSQDDIDALFGGGSADEKADADDIDALFAK